MKKARIIISAAVLVALVFALVCLPEFSAAAEFTDVKPESWFAEDVAFATSR